jgi:hypothetical protein
LSRWKLTLGYGISASPTTSCYLPPNQVLINMLVIGLSTFLGTNTVLGVTAGGAWRRLFYVCLSVCLCGSHVSSLIVPRVFHALSEPWSFRSWFRCGSKSKVVTSSSSRLAVFSFYFIGEISPNFGLKNMISMDFSWKKHCPNSPDFGKKNFKSPSFFMMSSSRYLVSQAYRRILVSFKKNFHI